MVQSDIIQFDETTSYCSPLIVVKKKDGGIRLVNNFMNLNSKTVNEQYMMNNLSDLVSRVAGARFITRMDIRQAFFKSQWRPKVLNIPVFVHFATHSHTRKCRWS